MSKQNNQHYLLTIYLNSGAHLHGYLMTNDIRDVARLRNEMAKFAELFGGLRVPIMLQTELTTGTEVVRQILSDQSSEAKHLLKTASDFHRSIFQTPADNPIDKQLMELH